MREVKIRMENKRFTAVLIDDESWTRDVLKHIGNWDKLGIDIIAEAADGLYGLEIIKKLKPDIILTDVKMPNMDGLELAKFLNDENYKAKILFISGYDDYNLVRTAFQLNANDYLLKPVKPDELNKQLFRCVEELSHERKNKSNDELYLERVTREPWIADYEKQRIYLYESLRAKNPLQIESKIKQIYELIEKNAGETEIRETMIYLYFDLHGVLRKVLAESGFSYGELFSVIEGAFVFGSDTSFLEIMEYMKNLYLDSIERMKQLKRERGKIDIQEIRKYIDKNYRENFTLEEVADKFYISREYLSKMFKNETGTGFQGYMTSLKMKKAKELLIEEKMAIKDIADYLGYKETGHFYKVFKKFYDITPGDMLSENNGQST